MYLVGKIRMFVSDLIRILVDDTPHISRGHHLCLPMDDAIKKIFCLGRTRPVV